jgi:hypothetical protein
MKKAFPLSALLTIFLVYPAVTPFVSAGMGQALYERWNGDGSADSMLTESSTPSYTEILTSTELDPDLDDYRARITAWLIPPVTGEYIFWLVTDDTGRLWLSTDEDPANAQLIAEESYYAYFDGWGGVGDEAQSEAITLEGGKAYWLRGGHQEGTGGDHIRIGWASDEAGIDDHTIITGQYITDNPDIFYYYAYAPNPADGAINVPVEDVQLSWSAPTLVPGAAYNVYFGTDANDLPELPPLGLTEPTTDAGDLDVDETYVWRVDVLDPNEGGTPVVNVGPVWSFTTAPATPIILTEPQGISIFAGETAVFTISGYSANEEPLSYEWFKQDEPGTILSETDTLTITEADGDDEGEYLCTLSNTYGSVTSEPASLVIKRLVGHWPFNNSLDDIEGGNDGVSAKRPEYVEGIVDDYAVDFGARNSAGVDISTGSYTTASWTISLWEKASTELSGDDWEVMIGSGEDYGYGIFDIGRYQVTRFYLGVDWDFVYTPLSDTHARGEWHMLTATHDATTNKTILYHNGLPAIESNNAFPGFDPLIHVGNSHIGDYPYYGAIDDLRFYNYALDALEVAYIYTDVTGKVCFQNPVTDVSGPVGIPDCIVDIYDLVELAGDWLECNRVPAENCL